MNSRNVWNVGGKRNSALAVIALAIAASAAGAQSLVGSSSSSAAASDSAPAAAAKGTRIMAVQPSGPTQVDLYNGPVRPFSKMAVGVNIGTLGFGVETATPLSRSFNLRGGANFVNFGLGFGIDSAQYEGQAHLQSGHVALDFHPMGSFFRISPELLIFRSAFSASVYVPGASTFELGNAVLTSSATDPVHGGASLSMQRTTMPALTIGWGNMLGERRRHWTVPFEIGAAYTGHYTMKLNLAGTACYNALYCLSATSPDVQTNMHQEENNINETMKHFQVYPIVSTGFAYRF